MCLKADRKTDRDETDRYTESKQVTLTMRSSFCTPALAAAPSEITQNTHVKTPTVGHNTTVEHDSRTQKIKHSTAKCNSRTFKVEHNTDSRALTVEHNTRSTQHWQ